MNALHRFVKMKDGFAAVIIFVLSHLLFNTMSLLVVFLTTSQRLFMVIVQVLGLFIDSLLVCVPSGSMMRGFLLF